MSDTGKKTGRWLMGHVGGKVGKKEEGKEPLKEGMGFFFCQPAAHLETPHLCDRRLIPPPPRTPTPNRDLKTPDP